MQPFFVIPNGVRLDTWPSPLPQEPSPHPDIAHLNEELRRQAPQYVRMLDSLSEVLKYEDMFNRIAQAASVEFVLRRS